MISGLSGRVARLGPSSAHILAGGVQYEVFVPLDVLAWLEATPPKGEVALHIVHHFGQDDQRLFGFRDEGQREMFLALRGLKGIGPALALSLLSHLDGPTLLRIGELGDIATLQKIPRVGKSTAELIVFEIGRKIDRWRGLLGVPEAGGARPAADSPGSEAELALQALVQLGYKEKEARRIVNEVLEDQPELGASDLIREALRRR